MRKILSKLFILILISSFAWAGQIKTFTVREFAGLDSKTSSEDLDPKYGRIVENARFGKRGSIEKRLNRMAYNSNSLGAIPITYIDRIYIGTSSYLIVGYQCAIKVGDDSAGTFTDLVNGLNASKLLQGVTYKDFHYWGGGFDDNYRTDGTATNTKVMGCQIPANSATPAGAEGPTGALNSANTYMYKFAWVYDDYQISDEGLNALTVTLAGDNSVNMHTFGTAPTSATDMNLYRTKGCGAIYYYLNQVDITTLAAYNAAVPYIDNVADGSLSATVLHTDHDIPSKCKYFKLHKGRIFMAGNPTFQSRLYYTMISGVTAYPDIVPALNYLDVNPDDGDIITGLAVDPTGILTTFKKTGIYKVFTVGPPDMWSVSASFSSYGCIAPYSIAPTSYGIAYLARAGYGKKEIRLFNGQDSKNISQRVEPTLKNISDTRITNCVGEFNEGKYFLAYNDATTGTEENNRVIIYDFELDAYSVDEKDVNVMCTWYGGSDWGELYIGDSQAGKIYREEAAGTDVYHKSKAQLDAGTNTTTIVGGIESSPTLTLTNAITDTIGASIISTLTSSDNEVQDFADDDDTLWPSGTLVSNHLEINAKALKKIYWRESLGTTGDVTFRVRSGDTTGACTNASWSNKYIDPTGSDISDETAGTYIQYEARLYTSNINTVTYPYLYKDDYVVFISAGLGMDAENSIPFVYETGDWDLGSPHLVKRYRQLRTKHDATSGGMNIYYYLDGESAYEGVFNVDFTTNSDSSKHYFPANSSAFSERIRFRCEDAGNTAMELKELQLLFSEEPLR